MHHRRSLHRRRPRPHRPIASPLELMRDHVRQTDAMRPMRALTLIYHEDFEPEVTGIIQQKMLVARYTKIRDVIGARADIIQDADFSQVGKNNMLIIVATADVIHELAEAFRRFRVNSGHGLRGYITSVEGLI